MKIIYGIGLALIFTITYLVAGKLFSSEHTSNSTSESRQESKSANYRFLSNKDLPACQQYLTFNDDGSASQGINKEIEACAYHFLETEDFASLESSMSHLRKNQIRSPSGYWLQTNFYVGLERFFSGANDDAAFDEKDAYIRRWIEKSGGADTAKLQLSRSMMSRAAMYRGSEYAHAVADESFEKHHAQISKAKKFLLENEGISKRDPEWFYQMLNISNVEKNADEEKHRKLFDKAVSLYPDYYPIYLSASEFYLEKWHGEADSFEKFAREATATLGPAQAKAIYARIYRNKICGRCGDRDVGNWRDHWGDIQEGMDQVIKDFPDQWNINTYAQMACSAYEQDKTLELMKRIQGEPNPAVWNGGQFTYEYCANWSGLSN